MNDRIKRKIVIYCGFLLSLSAISIDITLPMFPLMASDFRSPIDSMQITITFYIAMLGLGQLLFGPLSDRFGRRKALFAGLALFLLGTLICSLASTLNQFMLGRVFQGIGGASAPVIARAMLRDLFSGRELASNMAIATGIFSIGPIVGPLIGVGLVHLGGDWRAAFAGLFVHTVILLLVLYKLPETSASSQPDALKAYTLWANLKQVVGNIQSRYFMWVNGIMLTSMILIISLCPVVYEREFGVTGLLFAVLFAMHGFGIIFGQALNHRLIEKIGVAKTAIVATGITIFAAACLCVFTLNHWLTPYNLSFFIFIFAIGFLSVASNAASLIMEPHGNIAGFTSSLQGSAAQVFSGIMTSLLALVVSTSTLGWALALLLTTLTVVAMLVFWVTARPDLAEHA